MPNPIVPTLLVLLLGGALPAADAAAAFREAMAGDDASAKKEAIRAVSSLPEEVAIPLLISAVGDRQAGDPARLALRTVTKLTPPARKSSSTYPGFPSSDDAAGWSAWLEAREKDKKSQKAQADLKKLEAKTAEADKDKEKPKVAENAGATPAATADAVAGEAPATPPEDLGKLDRIVFKRGGHVVAYIRSKRLDADGNLVSLRIVHPDGQGEEILDASLIARFEEDIR